jgi:hypothetical protein
VLVQSRGGRLLGTDASPEIQELARRITEAQIDLHRVRYARCELLSNALSDPDCESRASVKAK